MNWKAWLKFNPYKKLWCFVGRPLTYIWRDIYHGAQWVIQTFWFWLGILLTCWIIQAMLPSILGLTFGNVFAMVWKVVLICWLIYTFGYINGHIHWGKKYIPNQQGN